MAKQRLKICHDRVLPKDSARQQPTSRQRSRDASRAIIVLRKMWINGSTLRVRFMGGTSAQKALVREQAQWWSEHANLTFEFSDAPDAEIRILFDPDDGAWSYVAPTPAQFSRVSRR